MRHGTCLIDNCIIYYDCVYLAVFCNEIVLEDVGEQINLNIQK